MINPPKPLIIKQLYAKSSSLIDEKAGFTGGNCISDNG
jgi:hypothetical protein